MIQRYDYSYQCDGESGRCRERMVPTEDGDYVLYTDHAATVAALRATLTDAIDQIQHWASYADTYYREKWDYEEGVARLRAALKGEG